MFDKCFGYVLFLVFRYLHSSQCMKQMTLWCLNLFSLDFLPLGQCRITSLPSLTVFYLTVVLGISLLCLQWPLTLIYIPPCTLLANLSFIDLCLSTLTVPDDLWPALWAQNHILPGMCHPDICPSHPGWIWDGAAAGQGSLPWPRPLCGHM